jgi:hypothetical protein
MARKPEWWWRRVSAGRRADPDFVILGAQRAGTTSLYHWLSAQPGAQAAFTKEVHYFDVNYSRGARWYRAHFKLESDPSVCGEASPYLLFHPLAPRRLADDLPPTCKFIVLLRDPVERALSHYRHQVWLGFERLPLADAIRAEPDRLAGELERVLRGEVSPVHRRCSYVSRGEYADQLERWFEAVGRDRLLVYSSELLFKDDGLQDQVLDALGLSRATSFPRDNSAPPSGSSEEWAAQSAPVRAWLQEHYRPYDARLAALLGNDFAGAWW